jgi:hypothetical protein
MNSQRFTGCGIQLDQIESRNIVIGENKERWQELCELAAKEQDPQKLIDLMKEIERLLEIKLNRLKGVPPSQR